MSQYPSGDTDLSRCNYKDNGQQQAGLLAQDRYTTTSRNNSRQTQSVFLLIFLSFGLVFLVLCLGGILWLAIHGQVLVPMQDTRLTSIAISAGSKVATTIMGITFARSAWASAIPDLVAGRPVNTRRLVSMCRTFMSLGQYQNFSALPWSFKFHILLGAMTLAAMVATSSSFRYDSLPTSGWVTALVSDVAFACPADKVADTNLFICDQGGSNANILTNTSVHAWDYIGEVSTGGQKTVAKFGDFGTKTVGANVTLAALPSGWLPRGMNNLPWMAMWVTCDEREISVDFSGSGYETNTTVYLDNKIAAILDIGNMPQWGSIVHIFLRVNESGPFSSLGEYDVIMLGRDENDGSNMRGVSEDSVTKLGSTYMDLKGYGAVKQGLLGAAARCTFRAETGGSWQDGLWPPLNHTTNTVWGEIVNDRPTLATAMLNFGASWQYTSVSENSLPGGSVSYIGNNTGKDASFPDLFASYIRNQWALMAYAIPRHTYRKLDQPFFGSGPNKLFVSVTLVAIAPCSALVIGILVTLRAWFTTITNRYLVNRVEFESWWLVKALRPDLYPPGFCNATENSFSMATDEVFVWYGDVRPASEVGHLMLQPTPRPSGRISGIQKGRPYGLTA
ncbi:hypothetical protein B0J13DRAFT_486533 [Dactylonectria estremocensis]|uniref:Uncharacterized protein n=1 Tax=Dactylonectria estremocensis TaxID=1079267 RepID=A0A9P9DHD0_9HYPO|nr:hypothetical protein B0J13DRAFT_486533 [Dactylonectria estremocensis]